MRYQGRFKKTRHIVLMASLAYVLFIAALAWAFPSDGRSFLSSYGRWFLAVPLCLVLYAALEALGTWTFGLVPWQRMPRWGRICLMLVLLPALIVIVLFVLGAIRMLDVPAWAGFS